MSDWLRNLDIDFFRHRKYLTLNESIMSKKMRERSFIQTIFIPSLVALSVTIKSFECMKVGGNEGEN